MDENKFPEQEDNWLDDVLGPQAAGEELGPDESALFNEHLTDPGAPAEKMLPIAEEVSPVIEESPGIYEEIPEISEDIPEIYEQIPEIPAELPDSDSLPEIPDSNAEAAADMSSTQLLMDAVDALIAEETADELLPEEVPQEVPDDPSATMIFQAPEIPEPFRDEEYRDTFGEGTELAQIFSGEPLSSAEPAEPEPVAEEPIAESTEEPLMKKGRPKRKKGYGLLGIPHVLVTLVWLAIIAFIGVSLGRMAWLCVSDVLAFGQIPREATIVITEEDDLDSIAEKLHDAKLIKYPALFKQFAQITGKDDRISVGTFTFNEPDPETGESPGIIYDYNAIINSLREYAPTRAVVQVVIPEGYSCAQVFALLEEKGVCAVSELEAHAANGELKEYWFLEDIQRGSKYCLEGYLFPDTYQFYTNDDPQRVLEKFLNNFNVKFTDLMMEKLTVLNEKLTKVMESRGFTAEQIADKQLTVNDIVIVASMVQKEAGGVLESYDISSVIYNRLYRWELPYLNIDATIVYALGGKTDPLTYEDLQIDSPYNTYTHMGLTPGAISNPGLTSLNAALDPNDTDYFYYALNPETGEHKFSKTEKEHNDFLAKLKD